MKHRVVIVILIFYLKYLADNGLVSLSVPATPHSGSAVILVIVESVSESASATFLKFENGNRAHYWVDND